MNDGKCFSRGRPRQPHSGTGDRDIVEDLRNAQEQKGFISPSEFEVIARRRGLHVKDVHTIASFFPHFRLKPLARADIRVCDDMTCHLHGARQLRESLELRFAGQPDVLIRDVSCVGRCDHPLRRERQRARPSGGRPGLDHRPDS